MRDAQARLERIRNEVRDKRAERNALRDQFVTATQRATESPTAENIQAVARLKAKREEVDDELERLKGLESGALRNLDGRSNYGTLGVLADPEVVAALEDQSDAATPIGPRLNLGEVVSQSQLVNMFGQAVSGPYALTPGLVTTTDQQSTGPNAGIIGPLQAPLRLLDLIPTVEMTSRSVPYNRVVPGSGEGAGTVAAGAVKPASSFDFIDDEVVSRKFAVFVKLVKEDLADVPGLEQVVRNMLGYDLRSSIEAQVLTGDGTGQRLTGILQTTGIAETVYAAGQPADLVLDGVTNVILAGAVPNVSVLNPRDWARMRSAKDANDAYLNGTGPFSPASAALWDTIPVPSNGIAEGDALVMDTRVACRLHIREGINAVISDSDSDDVTRNRVTLLLETRLALTVDQPAAIAHIKLAA